MGGGDSSPTGTGCGVVASNRCMTDEEMQHVAELHFDGDPAVLAELRFDPEVAQVLNALDQVRADLASATSAQSPLTGGQSSCPDSSLSGSSPISGGSSLTSPARSRGSTGRFNPSFAPDWVIDSRMYG